MRRISLAVALIGAVAAVGCSGGSKRSSDTGGAPGVAEGAFKVYVQNGQDQPAGVLAIQGGWVTSNPAGIDCGITGHAVCSFDFPLGTTVTLTATASGLDPNYLRDDDGNPETDPVPYLPYAFQGWAGDCQGDGPCVLTGNADKYIVVTFGGKRTFHANFTQPVVHSGAISRPDLVCFSCHGESYAGSGIAPGCTNCHTWPGFVAAALAYDCAKPDAVGAPVCAGVVTATPNVESCENCHGAAAQLDAAAKHALSDQLGVKVSNVAATVSGTDVIITFNIKVNGQDRDDFLRKASVVRNHNEDAWWTYNTNVSDPAYTQAAPNNVGPSGVRTKLTLGNFTLASNGSGNYTATLPFPSTPAALAAGNAYMISVMDGTTGFGTTATVVASNGARAHDVIGDQACVNCHGQLVWRDAVHDVTYPQGVGPCVVCHSRSGSADPRLPGAGSGLMGIVHGVHNSHNMPDRTYTFTWTNGNKFNFSVGFPGYMNNCATCHDTPARLAAVASAPVSYELCISCHDSWDGFPETVVGGAQAVHRTYTNLTATNCSAVGCHDGTAAPATIAGFHDGLRTERNGLVYGGADQSVVQGKRIAMTITGTSRTGNDLSITWTATLDGSPVDPCNTTVSATAPIFHAGGAANASTGQAASNMSMLRAYAVGNDWVNDGIGTSPGQPVSTNLAVGGSGSGRTTCSGNVATTVVALTAGEIASTATRAVVSLQGKPQITYTPASLVIQVRSKSPTYEFNPSTGAASSVQRRAIVDTNKCLACHLGSLYQHGGNRVDNVDLCVMCHNVASSEKNVRVGMGVSASEAYDGKVGQTYDLRYMLHAVHSAGETNALLVYYRTNGIYAFGSQAAIDAIPNWPGVGSFQPYGAFATEPNRNHNEIVVHYPRPLQDCGACHVDGWADQFVNGDVAMAVTVYDSGATQASSSGAQAYTGVENANAKDDVLMGAQGASCMSCHQSGDPAIQYNLRSHAFGFGWTPAVFTNGRQDLINWATCGAATCP